MTRAEFDALITDMIAAYPGTSGPTRQALEAWFKVAGDLDHQAGRRAAEIITREVEFLRPGHNLGALLRSKATPVVTQATIEQHLHHAVYLARSSDGDPYGYLRRVSLRLLEMSERGDLFARDLTTEATGFRVRDIARQFQERRENEKRGFTQTEPASPERQITGPGMMNLTDDERTKNRERAKQLAERFGRKA